MPTKAKKAKKVKKAKKAVAKKAKKAVAKKAKKSAAAGTLTIVCDAASFLDLDEIDLNEDNPRNISDKNKARLRTGLEEVGLFKPFLLRKDLGTLLAGNQRLKVLREMKDDGWTIPPLPVVFVDADDGTAKAILIRDNIEDGEWELDGLSRYINDLSVKYGNVTADVLGFDKGEYGKLLEHYQTLQSEAAAAGAEAQKSVEERKEELKAQFIEQGLSETEAERRAEIYMYSGSGESWKTGDHPSVKGSATTRIEISFWFESDSQAETVRKAFAQKRTQELNSLRLFQIAGTLLGQGEAASTEPVKPAKKAKKVKKVKKAKKAKKAKKKAKK